MQERSLCLQDNGYLILPFFQQTDVSCEVRKKCVIQMTKSRQCIISYYLLVYQKVLFNYLKWFVTIKYTIGCHFHNTLARLQS